MPQDLSFYLIPDIHYYEPSLGTTGRAFEDHVKSETNCCEASAAVFEAVVDKILSDNGTRLILVPGDLAHDGEYASHLSLINQLHRLRAAGKKVCVISSKHDYNDSPCSYNGDKRVPVKGTKKSEIVDLYRDYGYGEAIAFDEVTLSYVVEPQRGYRVLMINCDGEFDLPGLFTEHLILWIRAQVEKAKKDGAYVFAVTHFPILPVFECCEFVPESHVRSWRSIARILADIGIELVFSGQMHIQSVNKFVSPAGNTLYDICTSSPCGFPGKFRKVTLRGGKSAEIKSIPVPDFDFDRSGLSVSDYFEERFRASVFHRIRSFLELERDGLNAYQNFSLRALDKMTCGRLCATVAYHADDSIKDLKVRDLVADLLVAVFAGDPPYSPETAVYQDVRGFLGRIPLIKRAVNRRLSKDTGETIDLEKLVLASISGSKALPDNNLVIKLK